MSTKFWPFHEIPHILSFHMKTTTPKHESEPAFPCATASFEASGLSKREWLAGLAMQGLVSSYAPYLEHPLKWSDIPELSVTMADDLLKELSK